VSQDVGRFRTSSDAGPAVDPDHVVRSGDATPAGAWLTPLGLATLLIMVTAALMRLVPEAQTGSST